MFLSLTPTAGNLTQKNQVRAGKVEVVKESVYSTRQARVISIVFITINTNTYILRLKKTQNSQPD